MTVHVLKTDEEYWTLVRDGKKRFEYRKDDRTPRFETDDLVVLVCGAGLHYGATALRRVGYVLRGGHVPEGYCVFELRQSQGSDDVLERVATGQIKVSE